MRGPVVVVGNCLAESVRLLLDPAGSRTVRVAPVFELDAAGTGALHRLLRTASALVAQPVRDDYRGLPLGTAQLRALLPPGAPTVVVPVVRHAGLHPFHVVHHPPDGTPAPPLVPYHDLRVVRAALHPGAPPAPPLTAEAVHAVAAASTAELRRREAVVRHDAEQGTGVRVVGVADLLEHPGPEHLRTVNHPGNPVLLPLVARVADHLGLPAPRDPGRPLLDAVRAPLEPAVGEAWGFAPPPGSDTWRLADTRVHPATVAGRHLAWYAAHPEVTRTIATRFAARAALLGLDVGAAA